MLDMMAKMQIILIDMADQELRKTLVARGECRHYDAMKAGLDSVLLNVLSEDPPLRSERAFRDAVVRVTRAELDRIFIPERYHGSRQVFEANRHG